LPFCCFSRRCRETFVPDHHRGGADDAKNNFIKKHAELCAVHVSASRVQKQGARSGSVYTHRHLEQLKRSAAVERLEGLEQTLNFLSHRGDVCSLQRRHCKTKPRGVSAAGQMINRTGKLYRKGRAMTFRLLPDQCNCKI